MPDNNVSSFAIEESTNTRPELSAKPADKRPIIIGVISAVVLILLCVGIGWLLFSYPETTAILRDIFIIFLGIGIFIIILLIVALIVITVYLALKVNDLIQLLDREIRPMLVKMQESINTVRGTTTFISDNAVQPVIATASAVSAIRAIFRALFRRS